MISTMYNGHSYVYLQWEVQGHYSGNVNSSGIFLRTEDFYEHQDEIEESEMYFHEVDGKHSELSTKPYVITDLTQALRAYGEDVSRESDESKAWDLLRDLGVPEEVLETHGEFVKSINVTTKRVISFVNSEGFTQEFIEEV